jgi:FkbM family methyltransferase
VSGRSLSAGATERESHAQFDEDRILQEIFGDRELGYCVEVGANDGVTGSASYVFEKHGWRCLLVEPIPARVEEIRRNRDCLVAGCAASSREGQATFIVAEGVDQISTLDLTTERVDWIVRAGGTVTEIVVRLATLDSLLEEAGFPEIQFITIDVEGHELDVLEGFSLERHQPRIVIVEDNSVDGDPRVARHMSDHGYVHFRRTGVNEWYAHRSDSELVQADRIRSFERAKQVQLWDRRRRRLANQIATRVGRHVPDSIKRPLRRAFESVRRP